MAHGHSHLSASYEWLVVAGARAQYKGTGTINGAGNYGFMRTAIDGQLNGGGGSDKLRIKMWDKVTDTIVYDNQVGAADGATPTTSVGSGSIIIHIGRSPAQLAVLPAIGRTWSESVEQEEPRGSSDLKHASMRRERR